jgi:hypothetical protein
MTCSYNLFKKNLYITIIVFAPLNVKSWLRPCWWLTISLCLPANGMSSSSSKKDVRHSHSLGRQKRNQETVRVLTGTEDTLHYIPYQF